MLAADLIAVLQGGGDFSGDVLCGIRVVLTVRQRYEKGAAA